MCGHCTAGIFLHEFIHRKADLESNFEEGHNDFDSINLCHYLLECQSTDLEHISPTLFLDPWYLTCACFRAGELIAKGHYDYSELLKSALAGSNASMMADDNLVEGVLFEFGITTPHISSVKQLYEPQTYLNPAIWKNVVGELDDWTEFSSCLLERYSSWWLDGLGLTKNDLNQQMDETGVFDPINDIDQGQWDRFVQLLPLVSFAIDVLGITQPSNTTLRKIGLNFPAGVPGFDALDLWIMRKALKYCFVHCSMSELEKLDHPDSLIYLEYAANQQDDVVSAKQKINSISKV